MKNRVIMLSGLLPLLAFGVACVARNEVVKIPAGKATVKDEGVFYTLPRTVIKAELPMDKTVKKEGKYRKFTQCFFFGMKPEDPTKYEEQGITVDKDTSFQIGDPVLTPESEPDPAERFLVKIKGHWLEDKKMSFTWRNDGVLSKGSTETTNKTLDVIVQGAQTGVSLIGKAGIAGARGNNVIEAAVKKAVDTCTALQGENNYAAALEAYEQLLRWQQERLALYTTSDLSVSSLPADTFQLKLKEIDSQIKAHRNLFFGTEAKETWTARFAVTALRVNWPQGAAENKYSLFRFSPKKGVCGPPKNGGEVSFLGLEVGTGFHDDPTGSSQECQNNKEAKEVVLKLKPLDPQLASDVATSVAELNGKQKRGFYYRIPATTTAGIFKGESEIKRDKLRVAQLGLIASLPTSTGSRRTNYEVELFEDGALKTFTLGSDALLSASQVKGFGDAAGAALDKRAELEKAEAAASSELNQMKKLSEQLAECKKLRQAQIDLNLPESLPKFCKP